MSDLPNTQRQYQITKRGHPSETLKCFQVPMPTLLPDEVLVKVAYCTPTPTEWKFMVLLPNFLQKGVVPMLEGTGTIVDANGHSELSNGQEVWCFINEMVHFRGGKGLMQEYAAIKTDLIFPIPPPLNLLSACPLILCAAASRKSLVDEGHLQAGQRVFINGATTACGIAGIQIAKMLGAAEVVVSCSETSFGMVKELGADVMLDYRSSPIAEQLSNLYSSPEKQFDLIYDCVGSLSLYSSSPSYLKPNCPYVSIAINYEGIPLSQFPWAFLSLLRATQLPTWLGGVPRKVSMSPTPVARGLLVDVVKWAGEGKFTVPADSVHNSSAEGVKAAFEKGIRGRAKGKILVDMRRS